MQVPLNFLTSRGMFGLVDLENLFSSCEHALLTLWKNKKTNQYATELSVENKFTMDDFLIATSHFPWSSLSPIKGQESTHASSSFCVKCNWSFVAKTAVSAWSK